MTTRRFLAAAITCLLAAALPLSSFAQSAISFSKKTYAGFTGSLAVADFDRDGRPDVAASAGNGLFIYRSGSGGALSFKAQYTVDADEATTRLYTAELNDDGFLDLIVAKEFRSELEIWYGNGDATFRFGQVLSISFPSLQLGLGDVNRDGTVDIVTAEPDDSNSGSGVYLNDGFGSFTRRQFVESEGFLQDFALADFDRDGWLDILFRTNTEFRLYTGDFDSFDFAKSSALPFASELPGTMTVGSFNRDTALDIAYRTGCVGCASTIHVMINDGSGAFTRQTQLSAGMAASGGDEVAAGDLNLDGLMDIVFPRNYPETSTRYLGYYLNNGDGTYTPFTVGSYGGYGGQPVLRRFNLDSRMDILLGASSGFVTYFATSGPTNCTPPGTASLKVKICAPGSGATVGKQFTVKAAADSPAGVVRMQLFVDGSKKYDVFSDQLRRSVSVAAGRHRITVRGYDKFGAYTQTTIYVTAQ